MENIEKVVCEKDYEVIEILADVRKQILDSRQTLTARKGQFIKELLGVGFKVDILKFNEKFPVLEKFDHSQYGKLKDSIDKAEVVLNQNRLSRRAFYYIGHSDNEVLEEIACMNSVHYLVREDILTTIVYARSIDAGNKMVDDLSAIADISIQLSHRLSSTHKPNVDVGEIHFVVGSLHEYI